MDPRGWDLITDEVPNNPIVQPQIVLDDPIAQPGYRGPEQAQPFDPDALTPERGVPGHKGGRRAEGERATWTSRFASRARRHSETTRWRNGAGRGCTWCAPAFGAAARRRCDPSTYWLARYLCAKRLSDSMRRKTGAGVGSNFRFGGRRMLPPGRNIAPAAESKKPPPTGFLTVSRAWRLSPASASKCLAGMTWSFNAASLALCP